MLLSPSVKKDERQKEKVIEAVNDIAAALNRLDITPPHAVALGLREFMRRLGELLAWGRGEREEQPPPVSKEQAEEVKEILNQALGKKLGTREEEECRLWVDRANKALDYLTSLKGV